MDPVEKYSASDIAIVAKVFTNVVVSGSRFSVIVSREDDNNLLVLVSNDNPFLF